MQSAVKGNVYSPNLIEREWQAKWMLQHGVNSYTTLIERLPADEDLLIYICSWYNPLN